MVDYNNVMEQMDWDELIEVMNWTDVNLWNSNLKTRGSQN